MKVIPNMLTYEQLQNAKAEDLQSNPELASTFGKLYGYDGAKLAGMYQSGYRSFDQDKAYTLSDRGGFNFGQIDSHFNRYSNLNNPQNPTDYAAAQTSRTAGLGEISKLEEYYRGMGLDPSTISQLQKYKTDFGAQPGGGVNSIQAAEAYDKLAGVPTLRTQGTTQDGIQPPAGATIISGPSGLQGLSESQIWRQPGTNNIYKLNQPLSMEEANNPANWKDGKFVGPGAAASGPPAGASLISGPSGLQGLTESQLWRDPNSSKVYKLEDKRLPGESVADHAARLDSSGTSAPSDQPTGTSDSIRKQMLEDAKAELLPGGKMPNAPQTAEDRIKLRRDSGIMNDEQDLSDLRNESRQLQQQMREFKARSGEGVTEGGRLGMVSEAERNLMFRMEGLAIREQSLIERVNSKNAYINQSIQDQQWDYNAGLQRWNQEFEINSKVNELVNSKLDQDKKDALTTVNTITNLMSEAGVAYDHWSPEMKTQVETAAMKLGLPKELFKTVFSNLNKQEKVLQTQFVNNSSGGMDVYSVIQDGTGAVSVVKAGTIDNVADETEKDFIRSLVLKYPDAGISLDDSVEEASEKLKSSAIYQLDIDDGGSDEGSKEDRVLTPTEAQTLGVPYGTTQSEAYGNSPTGKPSAEQSKARQFAVTAADANKDLKDSGYDLGWIENPWMPNILKGEKRQKFEQAARAFVNATLRRESGATITDSEYKNKYKELIPAAGDSQGVKDQKEKARDAAVKSIQDAGGEGGDELELILENDPEYKPMSDSGKDTLSKKNFTVSGYGSKYWSPGLDAVMKGGKGAPIRVPFEGTVIAVASGNRNATIKPLDSKTGKSQNKGFGNQVKIRLAGGREIWLSHLDSVAKLKPGQKINPGTLIGTQGNTGHTYGNTGVHLDITMVKPEGGYYSAKEVEQMLS